MLGITMSGQKTFHHANCARATGVCLQRGWLSRSRIRLGRGNDTLPCLWCLWRGGSGDMALLFPHNESSHSSSAADDFCRVFQFLLAYACMADKFRRLKTRAVGSGLDRVMLVQHVLSMNHRNYHGNSHHRVFVARQKPWETGGGTLPPACGGVTSSASPRPCLQLHCRRLGLDIQ